MSSQIRISAKNLGSIALKDFCPRCFWIKLKLENKLPFQIFPGIFSSIDSYTKTIVHSWFDIKGKQPDWLNSLGKFKGYMNPPHHSKFNSFVNEFNILLTGSPDGILIHEDNTISIIDYKTAKFTSTQDSLFPMYEAQLNSYGLIAKQLAYPKINQLALIYAEPITSGEKSLLEEYYHEYGFAMGFSAHIEMVKLDTSILDPLFDKVRNLYDMIKIPERSENCKDCEYTESLVSLFD